MNDNYENGGAGGNGNNDGGGGGGGSIGGDSDGSHNSIASKVCRDFMRNVCRRGKNCRFVHPDNIKVRTDPIFCHDFTTGRCFRSNCKFIHCSPEDEEHYKLTGELPSGVNNPEDSNLGPSKKVRPQQPQQQGLKAGGGKGRGRPLLQSPLGTAILNHHLRSFQNGNSSNEDYRDVAQVPICKDFLKGLCDRPPGGCRYRHPSQRGAPASQGPDGYGRIVRGGGVVARERGSTSIRPGYVTIPQRRKVVRNPYDEGPAMKRYHLDNYSSNLNNERGGYTTIDYGNDEEDEDDQDEEYEEEVEEGGYESALAPPPPRLPNYAHYANYAQNYAATYAAPVVQRNGYLQYQQFQLQNQSQNKPECLPYYQSSSNSDAMKALEDENFMLKRRIEELKTSNEFLLNQNAQLRLNNSLSAGTTVAQVQPLAVSAVSVSGAMPTAQPSIIGITSSSLSATQPLPTISISTLPTVSSIITPVSISQSLQSHGHSQSQSQAQLYIPAPN